MFVRNNKTHQIRHWKINRTCIKISNSVGRNDNFLAMAWKLSILPTLLDIFDIWQHYVRILYLSHTIYYSLVNCQWIHLADILFHQCYRLVYSLHLDTLPLLIMPTHYSLKYHLWRKQTKGIVYWTTKETSHKKIQFSILLTFIQWNCLYV